MLKVPLFDLNYDQEEENAVLGVLRDKWLSSGPRTKEFEKKFSDYLGQGTTSCAVSSGTAALHISLLAAKIQKGDEIIISGLSFIAALNVVTLMGAVPVLADSESFENWNVSPSDIAGKINSKTKAIIIVHFAGYPCEMDLLTRLAKEKNLILIEDAAHAVGARYKNRHCGTFGDMACFSFFSNKNLSTGEGGMFVASDPKWDEQARLLRSHGMTSMSIDRFKTKNFSYDALQPGLNYRPDEIHSALGVVQLNKLERNNKKRKLLVQAYISKLSDLEEVVIPWQTPSEEITPAYHIFPILLPKDIDRDSLMEGLKKCGIQTSIHYPAYNQFSFYKEIFSQPLKVAGEICAGALTLPLFPDMTLGMVSYVCDSLRKLIRR